MALRKPSDFRVFLKQKSKMTGDCYVFKFLRCSVNGKQLMRFQSETSVFKFPLRSVGGVLAKGGEIRDTKPLNLSRIMISLQAFCLGQCFAFFALRAQLLATSRDKCFCCGLKKVVTKSRARVYFGEQILAL